MKTVLILQSGETAEVNDSYGARLIEQGKAVVIQTKAEKKPAEEKTAEKPKSTRKK